MRAGESAPPVVRVAPPEGGRGATDAARHAVFRAGGRRRGFPGRIRREFEGWAEDPRHTARSGARKNTQAEDCSRCRSPPRRRLGIGRTHFQKRNRTMETRSEKPVSIGKCACSERRRTDGNRLWRLEKIYIFLTRPAGTISPLTPLKALCLFFSDLIQSQSALRFWCAALSWIFLPPFFVRWDLFVVLHRVPRV